MYLFRFLCGHTLSTPLDKGIKDPVIARLDGKNMVGFCKNLPNCPPKVFLTMEPHGKMFSSDFDRSVQDVKTS
jgi:hypothetical protein